VLILLVVWIASRGSSSAPAADDRTVLVTALEVRGQTDGADYVGRAFAEAMAVNLAQAAELRVLPVPSPEEFEGPVTAAEARRHGAGLLLGGALTRSAETIHASLSLVDTTQNRILWGAQQDAPEGDLAKLAAALAREGLEKLGLGAERVLYDRPQNLTGGPAMAASAELAQTIGALRRYQLVEARDASRELVEAFPEELDAQILRAATLSQMYFSAPVDRSREELDRQLTILKRRAPDSPYTTLFEATISRDMAAGIAALTALLQRDDLTPAFRGVALRTRAWAKRNAGDPAGAVADLEEALNLDPADAETLSDLGYVLREANRPEEAVRRARQAVALEPSLWFYRHALGHALSGLGRDDEAAAAYEEACRIAGLQQPCAAAAGALYRAGREEEALEMARKAAAMEDSMAGVYNLACFHALRGDRDRAMAFLQRGMEELGWFSTWLADDPDLESLHGDPEFEAILEELRRRQE
jgi:tetratricopeptide (TPR) repeat protein